MTIDIIPQGIEILKGPKRAEKETIDCLNACCEVYPNGCGHEVCCQRLYSKRCNRNPKEGGWKWGLFMYRHQSNENKYQNDAQRYCGTLPTLSFVNVRDRIRQTVYGGML